MGVRHRRVRGDAYYQLLDEFITAVKRRYGNTTIIHFEDMSYDNGNKLLNMYRGEFPCYNDDLQVGAVVAASARVDQHIDRLSLDITCVGIRAC